MDYGKINGNGSKTCCPVVLKQSEPLPGIIVSLLKPLFIVIGQAFRGETYPYVLVIGIIRIVGIADGRKGVFGKRYSPV